MKISPETKLISFLSVFIVVYFIMFLFVIPSFYSQQNGQKEPIERTTEEDLVNGNTLRNKDISTKNLVKIWEEAPVTTELSFNAYLELERRGYWEKEKREDKKEAQKILKNIQN